MMANEARKPTSNRGLLLLVLAALVPAFVGCGQKEYGSVSGKVTVQGRPVTEGTLVFSDTGWGHYMTAPINPDGTYSIKATRTSGLLVDGIYTVTINPPILEAPMGLPKAPPKTKPFPVPSKYQNLKTTDLKHEQKSASEAFDVEIK